MRRQAFTRGGRGGHASWRRVVVTLALLLPLLVACGGDNDSGNPIDWQPGLPEATVPPDSSAPTATAQADAGQTDAVDTPQPTETASAQTGPQSDRPTGRPLSAEELADFEPNELGKVLVLEYHQLTNNPDLVAQFVRTYDSFRADLQWLYDNNFYIVSMREVIENRITAPAGKKPVVLTFDDSPVNQFRFVVGDNGSLTVDPGSAVGIMEEFFAAHPDFGRGGMFGVLPTACFNTGVDGAESDQTQYCSQKLGFLIDNGYEVENHTLNHASIYDVADDVFLQEVGGAIEALKEYDARVEANIFVVPFGMYPNYETRQQQREWMRNGFEYNGTRYQLIGSLMVGSEPAFSPASTEWDSMWIYRIQMCDCTAVGGFGWDDYWQQVVIDNPGILYVSDGDPNTITVPTGINTGIFGDINDESRENKEIVRY